MDVDEAFTEAGLIAFDPNERVAVARGVRDIDVHVKGLLFGDDGRIQPREGR